MTSKQLSPNGSYPGPEDITRVELPNGIIVLARANFNSPSVVLNGYLSAGSLSEPLDKLGLANFTAAALMRGSQQHDFQQIYDILESVGAGLGFSGGVHSTSLGGMALVEDLPLLLRLTNEILRYPTFPVEQIERLRTQLLTGLAIQAQDTAAMAHLTWDQIVYQDHPYSLPEEGQPETIARIQPEDLHAFHQQFYGPRGMVIILVGAVEPDAMIAQVEATLGDWQNPAQQFSPPLPSLELLSNTVLRKVPIPGKSQVDIILGNPGPTRRSPDFLASALGNSILGQFGMYGRIGEIVREQEGLAYYAYSSLSAGIGPGAWYASAGVDPVNIEKTIALIRQEWRRMIEQPVSAEELADSQANFIGRLPLRLESNGGVASALLRLERHQLGLDYYQRYTGLVRSLTTEQVLAAAQHYLDPDRMGIAIAGVES